MNHIIHFHSLKKNIIICPDIIWACWAKFTKHEFLPFYPYFALLPTEYGPPENIIGFNCHNLPIFWFVFG